jgi:hypothetical protein
MRPCGRTPWIPTTAGHRHCHRKALTHDPDPSQGELRAQAGALRLHGLLAHWAEVCAEPAQARWVAQLLAWEGAERGRRSLERRLREAHIGRFKPLADFDWSWPKSIERGAVKELMTLDFLKEASNVVLVGPNEGARRRAPATWATKRCWPGTRRYSSRRAICWASWPRWTASRPSAAACASTPRRTCC